ncbi:FKBP-type peptidyl-prolyl cis-trans isomerase [Candidatus Daviesbacteria bacterium]|nr:FKBP-type peptidyl-prolyl cis-trans isomerase [Candidatus Daviesbacteria bacterium]
MPDTKFHFEDIKIGNGEEVKSGDYIRIHYKGTLENGTEFDSSYKRGEPFKCRIGAGEVIEGWDMGVLGMKLGGKRKLIVPPKLAYQDQEIGDIPPNSTLIFEVELIGID